MTTVSRMAAAGRAGRTRVSTVCMMDAFVTPTSMAAKNLGAAAAEGARHDVRRGGSTGPNRMGLIALPPLAQARPSDCEAFAIRVP